MKGTQQSLAVVAVILVFSAGVHARHVEIPDVDVTVSSSGVVPLSPQMPSELGAVFVKYSRILAPNGKPIHIFAQDGWSDARIVKARKVLEHMLTDAPGSRFGSDKTAVANAMADNRATLVLFNTVEDLEAALEGPLGELDLGMQDLRANECPVEGDSDYMRHETRDASYEEVLHMVHDYGIKPALPEYQAVLQTGSDAATKRGIWRGWPDDEPENHPNEYIGVLYDNYLDLWTPNPTKYEGEPIGPEDIPKGQSHFGRFHANSRARLLTVDPRGYELVEMFFPPYLTYSPELPEGFKGVFSLEHDPELRYTYKSQHLRDVTLTGSNDAGLVGNRLNNRLQGNAGDNSLTGGAGNDLLLGGDGVDTAIYVGSASDYEIDTDGHGVMVEDLRAARDGRDTLLGIERLRFADKEVPLNRDEGLGGDLR